MLFRRRSKTDATPRTVYLTPVAMAHLDAIRPEDADGAESVFGLSVASTSRRVKTEARAAGYVTSCSHTKGHPTTQTQHFIYFHLNLSNKAPQEARRAPGIAGIPRDWRCSPCSAGGGSGPDWAGAGRPQLQEPVVAALAGW